MLTVVRNCVAICQTMLQTCLLSYRIASMSSLTVNIHMCHVTKFPMSPIRIPILSFPLVNAKGVSTNVLCLRRHFYSGVLVLRKPCMQSVRSATTAGYPF